MNKITFLINHTPNPRILKRCKVLDEVANINLVYWDRLLEVDRDFQIKEKWKVSPIKLKAPLGKPILRMFLLVIFLTKVLRILNKENADVVYAEKIDMLFIAWIYKLVYNKNTKIIYEVADLYKIVFYRNKSFSLKKYFSKIIVKIEKTMSKSVDLLVLTSPHFWEEYYSDIFPKEKYLLLLNAPSKKTFSNFKKEDHSDFVIGYIGSIRYKKQLEMLIDVVEGLKNTSIFIAGDGPDYHYIKNYSANKDFIKFHGPYNYFKEIKKLYSKIDCVFSVYDTSYSRNIKTALPNRLYEAIICELPIIVADNTKLGEFVKTNKIGFVIGDSDDQSLKETLIQLDSENIYERIKNNINAIKDNYYAERFNHKLLENYNDICNIKN